MRLDDQVYTKLQEILKDTYDSHKVDFNRLCQKLNVSVFMADFVDQDINGMVKRQANDSFEVYLKKTHSKNRKRFTLAHELGHIISYRADSFSKEKLSLEGYLERRTQSKRDIAEIEANEIAACILMPEEFLESLISKLKNPTLKELSEEFGVSSAAMSVRLNKLGYDLNDFISSDY
ncbi:MAG: ImmA/IrrE family metallo-endopeptidase [Vampirovibrionales bacterium]|nr:ImmA/IrrE family metallo-endopeptidase [Vampirovibrionales bacterium]